jgi:hypothetical protein
VPNAPSECHEAILNVAQDRQIVTGFPFWQPRFNPRSANVGFVVDKVTLRQVSNKYISSLANSHAADCYYSLTILSLMLYSLDTVTDLINALPGNSSVNMVHHTTIDEAVFSMSSAPCPVRVTDQWTHKFSVRSPCWEVIREYWNGNWLDLSPAVPREQQCDQKKN